MIKKFMYAFNFNLEVFVLLYENRNESDEAEWKPIMSIGRHARSVEYTIKRMNYFL